MEPATKTQESLKWVSSTIGHKSSRWMPCIYFNTPLRCYHHRSLMFPITVTAACDPSGTYAIYLVV